MFKDLPLETRKPLVKAMVGRMAEAYGIKRKELPKFLNCQKSLVSNWGYYGRIPYDYLDQCSLQTGVAMDWLVYDEKLKVELTADNLIQLRATIAKLFVDGLEYKMIAQLYPAAIKQLSQKFEKDVLAWLGVNDVAVNVAEQQLKQTDLLNRQISVE
jgi:hypothetical protein